MFIQSRKDYPTLTYIQNRRSDMMTHHNEKDINCKELIAQTLRM